MRKLIFVLLPLAFLAGNVWRISPFSPDIRISVLDLSVTILIAIAALINVKRYISCIFTLPTTRAAGIFLLIALLSLLLSIPRYGVFAGMVGFSYLVRWLAYTILLPAALLPYIRYQERVLPVLLGSVLVITGYIQYSLFPDIRPLQVAEWDPHYYRIVGSLLDPGFLGILFALLLVCISSRRIRIRYLSVFSWALVYLALAFTYSRSSFLGFMTAMGAISVQVKNWRIFAGAALLMLATLFLLPRVSDGEGVKLERTSSIAARIMNWGQSLTIIRDHPFLGVGFNVYRYAQHDYGYLGEARWLQSHAGAGADSSLLFVAATTGIIGLSAYLWYLKGLFSLNNVILKISLVTLLIHSWFLNSLFYPFILCWLAVLVASSVKFTEST